MQNKRTLGEDLKTGAAVGGVLGAGIGGISGGLNGLAAALSVFEKKNLLKYLIKSGALGLGSAAMGAAQGGIGGAIPGAAIGGITHYVTRD